MEFHDLPNTATLRDRWVRVDRRPSGAILCREFATSKATGCDLPSVDLMVLPEGGTRL